MTASILPPEVAASLDLLSIQAPGPAARAETVIRSLLAEVSESAWPDIKWRWSTLTGDGFPLEFSFSSGDDEIRYAAECAPPETHERDRLGRAIRFLQRFGMPAPDMELVAFWRGLQAAGSLRYGAFVGVRHGRGPDRFKLYVEIPAGCPRVVPHAEAVCGEPVMIGHDPIARRTEVYFRCGEVLRIDFAPLMARIGLGARSVELLRLIESVWGRPIRRRVPGESVGVSLSASPGGYAFAVFNYADNLFATDAAARDRVLAVAAERGWTFSQYERLTRVFVDRQPETLAHTILTYAVADGCPPRLDVGLRPII
jgi:hypothetical protein